MPKWLANVRLLLSTNYSCCFQGDNCQYRHALPPGFVLKSEKKAKEDAEKANTISIEEFLETEVRSPIRLFKIPVDRLSSATQARPQPYTSDPRDIRKMETKPKRQEGGRRGGNKEGERCSSRCWQVKWYEWKRSSTCGPPPCTIFLSFSQGSTL